ncbi:MAG: hypothetical protein R6U95_09365 [Bacteroidales bacterium]
MQIKKLISYNSIFLACISIYAFILHFISLNQTGYANGWDSYFYLLQVKSLIQDGNLVSSRVSLIYPILSVFVYFCNDYILAWKIFTAILVSLSCIGIYKVITAMHIHSLIALITAAYIAISPHMFYFSAQYTKNILGFVFFLFFLVALYNKNTLFIIITILLNLFTHKLTGFLAIGIYASIIAYTYIYKHTNKKILLLWISIPLILICCIPTLFDISDLTRQQDLISTTPQWYPILFFKDFKNVITIAWKTEIIASYVLCIAVLSYNIVYKKNMYYYIIPILFIALNLPFLQWDIQGFSFRFFMFSLLLPPICIGIILENIQVRKYMYSSIPIILFAGIFTQHTYSPQLHDPNYEEFEHITENTTNTTAFKQAELIIAHKGLAEFIKFTTNKDAMSWIPEYHIHTDSLWRITAGISTFRLQSFLPDTSLSVVGYNYHIMREKDWQKFLTDVQKNHTDFYDDYTTWLNPNNKRPAFMQKYRRKHE